MVSKNDASLLMLYNIILDCGIANMSVNLTRPELVENMHILFFTLWVSLSSECYLGTHLIFWEFPACLLYAPLLCSQVRESWSHHAYSHSWRDFIDIELTGLHLRSFLECGDQMYATHCHISTRISQRYDKSSWTSSLKHSSFTYFPDIHFSSHNSISSHHSQKYTQTLKSLHLPSRSLPILKPWCPTSVSFQINPTCSMTRCVGLELHERQSSLTVVTRKPEVLSEISSSAWCSNISPSESYSRFCFTDWSLPIHKW